jgi:glutathione S-transferase
MMESAAASEREQATLYVIPGSHACMTSRLMLEHKGIAYRCVELPTGAHGLIVRMHGFPGHRKPIRTVDGNAHRSLATLDRLGTVPALRFRSEKVQTNRKIARFLDRVQPQPPLFPADRDLRRAVEEAEEWGDETFQMAARRITLCGAAHGLDSMHERGNRGRLGPLLATNESMRVISGRVASRLVFRADSEAERTLLEELPAMLAKIDAWIESGVLDAPELNAADFTIASSLALISYRLDLRADIEARGAGAWLERVLPEPPPAAG